MAIERLFPGKYANPNSLAAIQKEEEKRKAANAIEALGAAAVTVPLALTSPLNRPGVNASFNSQQKLAPSIFPNALPEIFVNGSVPRTQSQVNERLWDTNDPYKIKNEYLTTVEKPGAPSPELGSYQQAIGNKTLFPQGDIQAVTVTPGPNPSRFAKDYAEILADKLGKTINEYEQFTTPPKGYAASSVQDITNQLDFIQNNINKVAKFQNKISTLSNKVPGTAGYVWGNTAYPEYSYAEGNWALGEKFAGANPSIYLSRINADPSKEADYLFTSNILKDKGANVDPRANFKQYPDLGPGTGPSWGISEASKDISFRKDLIGARGELTTGDLQALLAERNLPFKFQTQNPATKTKPGDLLRENLQRLADVEKLSTYQTLEKYARSVPARGESVTPPTPGVIGVISEFPSVSQLLNPESGYAKATDLKNIGILPSKGKSFYTVITEPDEYFGDTAYRKKQGIKSKYGASTETYIPPRSIPAGIDSVFEEYIIPGGYGRTINRDVLRPLAAQKLLRREANKLLQAGDPVRGLGLGGFATGGLLTATDPAVIDALSAGDYLQAGTTAAMNTAIGSAVGRGAQLGLQNLATAGYVRPAALVGGTLPMAGGVLAGLGAIETGKALNRAYNARTGKDWTTRNQAQQPTIPQSSITASIQPRMGTAILNGRPVQVPYGSVAGTKKVGRPWWDQLGSKGEAFADLLNRGSIIGR
jgi:hypothetical protein